MIEFDLQLFGGRGASANGSRFTKNRQEEVGDDLYSVNKMAKNIRDAIFYEKGMYGYGLSAEKKNYFKNEVMNVLEINAQEYNQMEQRDIERKLKAAEEELYNLKDEVIKKAKSLGIKDIGYHAFETENRYGTKSRNYARYIEIGGNGFHYNVSKYPHYDIKEIGVIQGMIQANNSVPYDREVIKRLKKFVEK